MREKVEEMGLCHPYIATNGATIMEGSKAVVRKQFPIAQFREVANFAGHLVCLFCIPLTVKSG